MRAMGFTEFVPKNLQGHIITSYLYPTDDFDFESGFDLFYQWTPSLAATLTLNTDFAETETDQRRVNLTRFPPFFPEKRDFFLKGADQD